MNCAIFLRFLRVISVLFYPTPAEVYYKKTAIYSKKKIQLTHGHGPSAEAMSCSQRSGTSHSGACPCYLDRQEETKSVFVPSGQSSFSITYSMVINIQLKELSIAYSSSEESFHVSHIYSIKDALQVLLTFLIQAICSFKNSKMIGHACTSCPLFLNEKLALNLRPFSPLL